MADHPVFATLGAAERVQIAAVARPVRFGAGQRVFAEGAPARGCWLLQEGRVALEVDVPGGGRVVVQTLGPGDLLGWSWFAPPYRWQVTARALGPTSAIELDTTELRAMADQDPRFGYALARTLFAASLERLQATRARLLDLRRRPDEPRGRAAPR
ncbi:cyclic nucleotide-binding domain-containing protein [Pseudonocardia bannensis]|uniref:Cyclic nucleotide-binding domain-containing protein n=1 Tax=Pseudonocardia bannensis TaxID=630973 RepID=A0A848DGL5_9PSEU|nr:cyclic nucleotide-binding domain-containing protein [Pseudonocardia bannensis]